MSDPAPDGLLEVGRVGRAHGLNGEVAVTLTSNRLERVEPGAVLQTERGDLTVVAARPHRERWLVTFDGVGDRDAAERLSGLVLWGEPLDDEDALWVHELIGCRVRDQAGVDRGVVTEVVANPAADLLQLDDGSLVPLTFVVSLDAGVVDVDVPEGLFDLDGG